MSERQWGRSADAICDFQRNWTARLLGKKKKSQTKNQTTKSPLWKVLGNLKSLTWLEFVEWKSLTKEIQTLQGKKTQLKHTTKSPTHPQAPKAEPPKVDRD